MNKVPSVHVLCVKRRLTETDITAELEVEGYLIGGVMIRHIDSFSSNTAQGWYETLCAQTAALTECKKDHPDLDEIVLCSDQGSGYESPQTILGLEQWKTGEVQEYHLWCRIRDTYCSIYLLSRESQRRCQGGLVCCYRHCLWSWGVHALGAKAFIFWTGRHVRYQNIKGYYQVPRARNLH